MMYITIEKEQIMKEFKELGFIINKTHQEIVENAKLSIDNKNDIEATMPNGKKYWIVTTPVIKRFNKNSDYEISIFYEIKEDSKYNKTIYSFTK